MERKEVIRFVLWGLAGLAALLGAREVADILQQIAGQIVQQPAF